MRITTNKFCASLSRLGNCTAELVSKSSRFGSILSSLREDHPEGSKSSGRLSSRLKVGVSLAENDRTTSTNNHKQGLCYFGPSRPFDGRF